MMRFSWPAGFERIPDQPWVTSPLETLALKYDSVEGHGWYRNLEPTVEQLLAYVKPGALVVDYSGGTGILVDRLLQAAPDLQAGFAIVDASPKFLRLALDKLGADERLAFRWIRYIKEERRLEALHEVLPGDVKVDAVVSTNAVHLYYGLEDTMRSWRRVLKPGAKAFVQSGNIRNPAAPSKDWIIDETVGAIHQKAMEMVASEPTYAAHRELLADKERMAAYDALRDKYFLPVRPLDFYVEALRAAGFSIEGVETRSIDARVDEWYDFLAVYHEGVLGWLGGSEKIDGRAPSEAAVKERLDLLRAAMERLFEGDAFTACWTYITAVNASD